MIININCKVLQRKLFGKSSEALYRLDEEEGIVQFANSINADLIAMGTHGRKGLSHMMSGSMTENVANHGKSLIWTYVMKKDKKQ